jgi:hypothetical protein
MLWAAIEAFHCIRALSTARGIIPTAQWPHDTKRCMTCAGLRLQARPSTSRLLLPERKVRTRENALAVCVVAIVRPASVRRLAGTFIRSSLRAASIFICTNKCAAVLQSPMRPLQRRSKRKPALTPPTQYGPSPTLRINHFGGPCLNRWQRASSKDPASFTSRLWLPGRKACSVG